MKPQPSNQLDPRVKNVWRINDGLWITICLVIGLAVTLPLSMLPETSAGGRIALMIVVIVAVVLYVLFIFVLPPIRYVRWRYEVSADYLDIAKGIIWRKRYTIPFIRVQNTDTRQGPILRMFHLSDVTIATAATEHVIPGLDAQTADELRDRAAEFARLAREDV